MFWNYRQNNSGGSFSFDKKQGISVNVVIEADSADDADRRAESIGIYFDDDCSIDCECCGQRWDRAYGIGDGVPCIYNDPIVDGKIQKTALSIKWMKEKDPEGFIHYKDGTVVPIDYE
jgi:hypothetical protein